MRTLTWQSRWPTFIAAAAAVGWLMSQAANAQPASSAAPQAVGPPMLHLSAARQIDVAPDELVADLVALSTSPSAIIAQRQVNTLMAQASATARQVPGVRTSFQDYTVSLSAEKPQRWTAQQTLELRGGESAALLDLVGRLQSVGLTIGSLGWQVSQVKQQDAHDAATTAALAELRRRAELAAKALGMEIVRFQDVRLDQGPPPIPRFNRMMAAPTAAAAMPPPNATPAPQAIGAEVSADVLLRTSNRGGGTK